MANGEDTFTELASLSGANVAANDEVPFWDVSAGQTKKTTRREFIGGVITGDGVINTNGKTLNVLSDGTSALLEAANAFTQQQTMPRLRSGSLGAISDDSAVSFMPTGSFGILVLLGSNLATASGILMYRCGSGSQCAVLAASAGTLLATVVDTVLTGTTGADGKITISANGGDGKIYVENRRGGSTSFFYLEIG